MSNSLNIESFPSIVIGKYQIWGTNHQELLGIKKEIFHEEMYEVELNLDTPFIIDAGAHVGLATLYFKIRHPAAKIICIEPNPDIVQFLKHNIWFNKLENIEVVEAALSDQVGERAFYADASEDLWLSTGGFTEGAWNGEQQSDSRVISVLPLDHFLNKPVDLLKMDIEGAEEQVLKSARRLDQVKQLIIELHPEGRRLPNLEPILNKFKFSHEITKAHYGLHRLYAKHH